MERFARTVLRHRRLVALFWLIAFVAGGAAAGPATERFTVDFSLPGQQGYETQRELTERFGTGPDNGSSIVTLTAEQGVVTGDDLETFFTALQREFPRNRVLWAGNTDNADALRTDDGRTAFGIVEEPPFLSFAQQPFHVLAEDFLAAQEQATGLDVRTTGYVELSFGDEASGEEEAPSLLLDTIFGALGALVVLLFVFASFLALLPLVIAAVSILSTFLVLLGMTFITDVSFVVQFLVALVGLGVAIDYSLLVVNRWREEREHGRDNEQAVIESMKYAGHAVVASAGTVAISLLALVVVPVPFLRSMGIGGMLIPLVSTAVVCTLLPVALLKIGPRVDWPRIRHEASASRAWTAWARLMVRRRWIAAAVGIAAVLALVAPVFGISIGLARTESLASRGPAVETLAELRDGGVPAGIVTPLEVLVTGSGAADGAEEVVQRVEGVDGIASATAATGQGWRTDDSAVVFVVPDAELVDLEKAKVVDRMYAALDGVPGVYGIAGNGANVQDYSDAVFGRFPLVMALIAMTTFLLLVRAFRSLLLPLKAVILNVLSVAATFGFVVLFWQLGYGSEAVFGIEATGAVTFWLPVLIFAFLFGLSMDYEVFILTRMREEYDKTGSTNAAVVEGLGRTGRLVTCAALILFLSFVALASSPGTEIKILATALGVGILLDATIVRALLVPALVSLMGSWNWWLPAWLAKPLRVEPSPRRPEPVAVPGQRSEKAGARRQEEPVG